MIKFLNGLSNVILFIMDLYIHIHNSVKDKDLNTIIKNFIDNVKIIFSFIKIVVFETYDDKDIKKYYNNDFILFSKQEHIYFFDIRRLTYNSLHIFTPRAIGPKFKLINCDIDCYPYIFIESADDIHILSTTIPIRTINKIALRKISLDDVILDSIDLEENKLRVKEIVKCSELYYKLTFNDGESFIILLDPINQAYSCYNAKVIMLNTV